MRGLVFARTTDVFTQVACSVFANCHTSVPSKFCKEKMFF